MHILTNERPAPIIVGKALIPGEWLVEDSSAAQIMAVSGGGEIKLRPWTAPTVPIAEAKKILIIRPGRFGDLIVLTPVLRRIKHLYPNKKLFISTLPNYRDPLLGLPYIDGFINYPIATSELAEFDCIMSLEVLTSLGERSKEIPMIDLFAERLGIDSKEMPNKVPDIFLSLEEMNWARDAYPRKTKRARVAFHLRSASRSKDYPHANMNALMVNLHSRGHEIVFLGLENQFKWATKTRPPGIFFTPEDRLTFRQSCAVLSGCDVLFGPDSAMIHAAAALGIPAVGVFSTTPWQLLTKYYPKCHVIQSKEHCPIAPCFSPNGFPADGPCAKSGHCDALHGIHPDRVAKKIQELLPNRKALT